MKPVIDSFRGKYRFLSNFEGGVEPIFQAMKTTDWREQVWVLSAADADESKKRGRKVTMRPDWNDIRVDVMEACLREKFSKPLYARLLDDTGDAELIEGNHWGDNFWGATPKCESMVRWQGNGRPLWGKNHLGILLMKIRRENRG